MNKSLNSTRKERLTNRAKGNNFTTKVHKGLSQSSYGLTVLQSYGLTILRSYGLLCVYFVLFVVKKTFGTAVCATLLLLSFATGYAQQPNVATATHADFSCPGEITVTYDLVSDQQSVDTVTLYYSPNKCNWLKAISVTGDCGLNVPVGDGIDKTIVWHNYEDKVMFGKFFFKVVAAQPTSDCVMINGVCWATRNVGMPGTFATNPEDAGMFYQWGSNVGWSSTDPLIASDGINVWRDLSESGNVWLPENDPSPAGYRVPTKEELESLTNTTYVTRVCATENGVGGNRFTDNTSGNTLFLPFVGSRNFSEGSLQLATAGRYWSSTPNLSTQAICLEFFCGGIFVMNWTTYKVYGFSVRCVAE